MKNKAPLKGKLFISTLLIVLFLGNFAGEYLSTSFSAQESNPFPDSKVNVLITGHDADHFGISRTDTLILVSIDVETREAGIVFIPRDTRLEIPGRGVNRVNAAYAFGGIDLTINTIENFLNVNIDYYADMNFQGFREVIDAIGGIEINVEKRMHYVDRAGDLYIDIPAGEQVLNGEQALHYVRYRESSRGDIGRVSRQQKFIDALIKQALKPSTIARLPVIYQEVNKAVDTNVPVIDISSFLYIFKDIDIGNLEIAMLPGEPDYINGASYWVPDKEATEALVRNLIRSKEYIANNDTEIVVSNGNGEPGIAGRVADDLEKYGFTIVEVTNANNYNYDTTQITYYSRGKERVVDNLLSYIGGEANFIELEEDDETDIDRIEIIIGEDFLERDEEGKGVNLNGE
ncbi:MAG: LCP family protein [Bacillota bacterium]